MEEGRRRGGGGREKEMKEEEKEMAFFFSKLSLPPSAPYARLPYPAKALSFSLKPRTDAHAELQIPEEKRDVKKERRSLAGF